MRAWMMVMAAGLLVSCADRKEQAQEQKIELVIPRPPAERSAASETNRPAVKEGELPAKERLVELAEVRPIIRRMIDNDSRLRELIKQERVPPLTRYLIARHDVELEEIAQLLNMKDKARLALMVSRNLVQKRAIQKETAGPPPQGERPPVTER